MVSDLRADEGSQVRQALELLRGLDRRLLGLEGDAKTPLSRDFSVQLFVVRKRVSVPDAAEVSRLEGELIQIRQEFVQIAAAWGLDSGEALEVKLSRFDADATYKALRQCIAHQRAQIRAAFESLHPRAGAAEIPGLTDDTEFDDRSAGKSLRRRSQIVFVAVFAGFILGLAYWAYAVDRNQILEVAENLCARPPPCAGDTMSIAYARGGRYQDTRVHATLVLYRKSNDCSYDIEVHYSITGQFLFRGSPDDPDPERRDEFQKRRETWSRGRTLLRSTPCDQASQLF